MGAVLKSSAGYAGGGGSNARHITRESELVQGKNGEERNLLNEEGPRFWTRNIERDFMTQADPTIGELAHHVYGHESDMELAEERLEEALGRGLLKPKPGEELKLRSAEERAEAMLKPRKSTYADASELEKEVINFRGFVDMEEDIEFNRPRRGGGKTRTFYHQERPLDVDIKNSDARALVNDDLENSPYKDLPTGCALHYHQGRLHAHVLTLARTENDNAKELGYKLQLGHRSHRSQDDRWADRWREYTGDDLEYEERKRKKDETKKYREYALEQRRQGLEPGREPERVQNLRNQKLLKLRSQIITDLITIGKHPEKYYIVEQLDKELSKIKTEPDPTQAIESVEVESPSREEIDSPFTTLQVSEGHQRQTKRSTKLNVQQPVREIEPNISVSKEQAEVSEPIPEWKLEVAKLAGDAISFHKVILRMQDIKLKEATHYLKNISYEDETAVRLGREVEKIGKFEYEMQRTSESYINVAEQLDIEVPAVPEHVRSYIDGKSEDLPLEHFGPLHEGFKIAQQRLPEVLEMPKARVNLGRNALEILQQAVDFSQKQPGNQQGNSLNQNGPSPGEDLELNREKERSEESKERMDITKEDGYYREEEHELTQELEREPELEQEFIL